MPALVAQPASSDPAQAPKVGKTAAKLRYLKKKKERRKARKSAAVATSKHSAPQKQGEEENASVSESEGSSGEDAQPEVLKPSRKKRKTIAVEDAEQQGATAEVLEDDEADMPKERSPIPTTTFPSFSAPVAPNAPSKSELALQGVDKALLDAETISSTHTLPLDAFCTGSSSDAQRLPVLSDRMKRRLLELEIVELFAGEYHICSYCEYC